MKKYAIRIQANVFLQGYDMLMKIRRRGKDMELVTFEAKDFEDAHKKVTQHIPDDLREEPYALVEV